MIYRRAAAALININRSAIAIENEMYFVHVCERTIIVYISYLRISSRHHFFDCSLLLWKAVRWNVLKVARRSTRRFE